MRLIGSVNSGRAAQICASRISEHEFTTRTTTCRSTTRPTILERPFLFAARVATDREFHHECTVPFVRSPLARRSLEPILGFLPRGLALRRHPALSLRAGAAWREPCHQAGGAARNAHHDARG